MLRSAAAAEPSPKATNANDATMPQYSMSGLARGRAVVRPLIEDEPGTWAVSEIVEELEAALEQFRAIEDDLGAGRE